MNIRPLVNVGLGLTYKLGRQWWLTNDLRYTQVLGGASFGATELQSQWQLSAAVALPSGFAQLKSAITPKAP